MLPLAAQFSDPLFALASMGVVAAVLARLIYKTTWLWSAAAAVGGLGAGVLLHLLAKSVRSLIGA